MVPVFPYSEQICFLLFSFCSWGDVSHEIIVIPAVSLVLLKNYLFNRHAKFSKKLTLLSPCYANVRIRLGGYEM